MKPLFTDAQLQQLDAIWERKTRPIVKANDELRSTNHELRSTNHELRLTNQDMSSRLEKVEARLDSLEERVKRIERHLPIEIVADEFEKVKGHQPEAKDAAYVATRNQAPHKEFSSIGTLARAANIKTGRQWVADGTLCRTELGRIVRIVTKALLDVEPRQINGYQYWEDDEQTIAMLTIKAISSIVFPEIYGELQRV